MKCNELALEGIEDASHFLGDLFALNNRKLQMSLKNIILFRSFFF
jgi:hypothetical protein